jgi:serine/threonine-protein kinase
MQLNDDVDFTGRTIDHYAIVALIRAGGQGRVYRARDEVLHREVAIKVLNSGAALAAGADHELIAEARALSSLNHPNVAGVYDFVTYDHRDFMVMELIAGATLHDILAGGALPWPEVVRLGAQLARGLAAAHAVKIAHCDVKPANLTLSPAGLLKIVDFGLATRLSPDVLVNDGRTTAAGIAGTLPYMAPEVLRGERPDERSDIFSAGTVLYEMATGMRAFPQTTLTGLVHAIDAGAVVPPSHLNPAVSAALDRVILRALMTAPSSRYPAAIHLAEALERLQPRARIRSRRRRTRTTRLVAGSMGAARDVTSVPAPPVLAQSRPAAAP